MTRAQANPLSSEPNPAQAGAARASLVPALSWFALALICLAGFFGTGAQYRDFALPQVGVYALDEAELSYYVWYALWGSAAVLFLTLAIMRSPSAPRFYAFAEAVAARPKLWLAIASLLVACGAYVVRAGIMLGQPIADDESTYLFEAQTLALGRVVNPAPPRPEFFKQQFLVINDHGWYGKYPLGHPALLALGERLGLRALIMPLCGLCSLWLCFLLGRQLMGEKRAALGAFLLALSPQFVWTHATLLSQPTGCLLLLAGMWALLRLESDARPRFALCAGLCFGLGLLVRPLPGGLFALVAVLAHVYERVRKGSDKLRVLAELGLAALPLAACAALFMYANFVQSGHPLRSGYSEFHTHGLTPHYRAGDIPNSFAGALLRQNFWLFGWTCSLALIPFCRPRRGAVLFWGVIAAEYSYRVLAPKTVVGATGPIYVFEIVPLLALASADGAVRLSDQLARAGVASARAWVATFAAAASSVALFAFVPIGLRPLATSSALRVRVYELLAERHATRALVFANYLVHPDRHVSWAYYPPHPAPGLDGPVVFPRWSEGPGSARAAFALWREQFPDRRAFVFYDQARTSAFAELDPNRAPAPDAELAELAGPVTHSGGK